MPQPERTLQEANTAYRNPLTVKADPEKLPFSAFKYEHFRAVEIITPLGETISLEEAIEYAIAEENLLKTTPEAPKYPHFRYSTLQ